MKSHLQVSVYKSIVFFTSIFDGLDSLIRPSSTYGKSLTHFRLNELPNIMYWKSRISILDISGYVI